MLSDDDSSLAENMPAITQPSNPQPPLQTNNDITANSTGHTYEYQRKPDVVVTGFGVSTETQSPCSPD